MPITDHKIASSAFTNNDVKALPDMPSAIGYTAAQLKARFDNVAENIVTPDNIVQITLLQSYWGRGEKYIKNGSGTQITDMDEYSICEPILTESNIAKLAAANKPLHFTIEPAADKFLFFLPDEDSPTTATKPADMTFYCRVWNPPSKRYTPRYPEHIQPTPTA